jgi:methyl-accepting chemotaxis protein
VDEVVGAAVTSLQFQDMVTQLLQHSRSRVSSMQDAWCRIGDLAKEEQRDGMVAGDRLASVSAEIAELFRRASRASERKPVRQEKMSSGEVELF